MRVEIPLVRPVVSVHAGRCSQRHPDTGISPSCGELCSIAGVAGFGQGRRGHPRSNPSTWVTLVVAIGERWRI